LIDEQKRRTLENMKQSFWSGLSRPFFILAPMAEVTDVVFRDFISRHASPDVFFTEFVACKGLLSKEGRKNLIRDIWYGERQRPIVAQIFGEDPEDFTPVAELLVELGFDGIDINMGCPVNKIIKQRAGSALIQDPERAKAIIEATKKGAGSVPVSVKTRIGFHKKETQSWIRNLCEAGPSAITVHARTKKEMSFVPAQWEEVQKAVEIAHAYEIPLIGNGDVIARKQGEQLAKQTGADGIMIGRGIYGNPWVFEKDSTKKHGISDRLKALSELIVQYDGFWGERKNYEILKRFFKSYIMEFDGAKELRVRMMETNNAQEALDILEKVIQKEENVWNTPAYKKIELASHFAQENKFF